MRYRVGQEVDPQQPYGESIHNALTITMGLSIVIGIILFYLGRRGKVMWLTVWSVGLILISIFYLVNDHYKFI